MVSNIKIGDYIYNGYKFFKVHDIIEIPEKQEVYIKTGKGKHSKFIKIKKDYKHVNEHFKIGSLIQHKIGNMEGYHGFDAFLQLFKPHKSNFNQIFHYIIVEFKFCVKGIGSIVLSNLEGTKYFYVKIDKFLNLSFKFTTEFSAYSREYNIYRAYDIKTNTEHLFEFNFGS